MTAAAVAAVVLMGIQVAFQAALAAGAPWGAASWGGRHRGVLPMGLRAASAVNALIVYPALILYTLASADLVGGPRPPGSGAMAMWVLTGFFGLSIVVNAASPSRIERIWAPFALALAVCCAVVAASL